MSRLHCFTVATSRLGPAASPAVMGKSLARPVVRSRRRASASAANGTWNSSAQFSSWTIGQDWVSAIVPGATSGTTTNTDTATFNTTSSSTLVLADSNRNLENIMFDATAAAYTINGGPLVLTSGGTIQIATHVFREQHHRDLQYSLVSRRQLHVRQQRDERR